jgi:hypothetical protein
MEIICHIIGITNIMKQDFINKTLEMNYNIIDLDDLSNNILNNETMIQMFKQYQGFKNNKNDKFKDIDKKMSAYWETTMEESIINNIDKKKKNVLIGYSHHYRNINKRLNIPHIKPFSKFIIKVSKDDVKNIITYNLDKHRKDIIRGSYPLDNIDFDFIYNNRQKLDLIYEKNGYLSKTLDLIYKILNLSTHNIDAECLWIATKEPYNVGSKIHPIKNKLFAFTDKLMALLSSFHFTDDELEKSYINNIVKVKPKKEGILERMNEKRYLLIVDKANFIPHEKGNNIKLFCQEPVNILEIIKINNVYKEYFESLDNK